MKRLLAPLGSLAITFPVMLALAACVVASYSLDALPRWLLALPLTVLTVNLLAALATHPRFRRQLPLLAFHLCLLAAMGLSVAALLTGLEARVEVLSGEPFEPAAATVTERGAWHPEGRLAELAFVQRGFTVDYAPGLVRGRTLSTVAVPDEDGALRTQTVGDTRPLVQGGFRVYTSSNKGYAAVLTWLADGAPAERGAVHFPSYPLNDWKQVREWRTPAGEAVSFELAVPAAPADGRWRFDGAAVAPDLPLVVRHPGGERRLAPGEWIALRGGRLRYDRPTTWMGYRIAYDPTLPWLLASGIVGALALAAHFFVALPAPAGAGARLGRARAAGA